MRRLAAIWFIDHRARSELGLTAALVVAFVAASRTASFKEALNEETRSALYGSLAGTSGALLGFVLAALAILVALPSTERLQALQDHPEWKRVPSSYFRASRALLAVLVLATVGIALDSAQEPKTVYGALTVIAVSLALVRVAAAVVALDQIMAVARAAEPKKRIDDPGL